MSNKLKILLLSMSMLLTGQVLAATEPECVSADSAASQISGLSNPPGYCTQIQKVATDLDKFAPPPPCAVTSSLQTYPPGLPALNPCPTGGATSSGGATNVTNLSGTNVNTGESGGNPTPSNEPFTMH